MSIVLTSCSSEGSDVLILPSECRLKVVLKDSVPYAEFFYTDWGAPDRIELADPRTGQWEYLFYYDQDKRLTALLTGLVSPDDTAIWTLEKYVYENDVIVSDTLFREEDLANGGGNYFRTGKYSYDTHKRIIEYSLVEAIDDHKDTLRYLYQPEDPFVNNHSILGGNKELMFVNRDYNKTNQGVVATNELGYPTKFSTSYAFLGINILAANYDCR